MVSLASLFERLFHGLASDIGYKLSPSELSVYIHTLQEYGLTKAAMACLAFREQGLTVFPSIHEFEKVIKTL